VFTLSGDEPTNNWNENPNGESYVQRIGAAGRSDVLDWARAVLAPRVQRVFDEFSDRYEWGDAGKLSFSNRAGDGSGRQGLGGAQDRQVQAPERSDAQAVQGLSATYKLHDKTMKFTFLFLVALSITGCGPSEADRQAAKERRAIEAQKADEQMTAGPIVVRHDRNGLTVWTIDIPRQLSSSSFVMKERCIAVATPGHGAHLSCEGHRPKGEDILDLLNDRDVDVRVR
jgi:hypothetical protein